MKDGHFNNFRGDVLHNNAIGEVLHNNASGDVLGNDFCTACGGDYNQFLGIGKDLSLPVRMLLFAGALVGGYLVVKKVL